MGCDAELCVASYHAAPRMGLGLGCQVSGPESVLKARVRMSWGVMVLGGF